MTTKAIPINAEPTQEYFLTAMRKIGFTEEDIEENRLANGRLFLTPGVVFGMLRGFEPGQKVCTASGDLISA
jgi:hypothetical protein